MINYSSIIEDLSSLSNSSIFSLFLAFFVGTLNCLSISCYIFCSYLLSLASSSFVKTNPNLISDFLRIIFVFIYFAKNCNVFGKASNSFESIGKLLLSCLWSYFYLFSKTQKVHLTLIGQNRCLLPSSICSSNVLRDLIV